MAGQQSSCPEVKEEVTMDQAICPYCNKTILLKDLISKPLAGKNSPSKSFLERLSSKDMLAVTSVYICPNCNKILSISR